MISESLTVKCGSAHCTSKMCWFWLKILHYLCSLIRKGLGGHCHSCIISDLGIDISTATIPSVEFPFFLFLSLPFSPDRFTQWIMWTHWSADWGPLFGNAGALLEEGLPYACFELVYARGCYLTACHYTLPLTTIAFYSKTQRNIHNECTHNQHKLNDFRHWLPSFYNYVPIVYFLAAYLFQRNSIIIALFTVKVHWGGISCWRGLFLRPPFLCFSPLFFLNAHVQ